MQSHFCIFLPHNDQGDSYLTAVECQGVIRDCHLLSLIQNVILKCIHVFPVSSMGRSSEEEGRGDPEEGGGGVVDAGEPDPTLPCTEDVILKTEQVTKNIQELLRAAQEFKHDRWEKDARDG